MGLKKIIAENNSKIGIWEIDESATNRQKEKYNLLKRNSPNKKRKNEWNAIQLLLNKINQGSVISYNKFGAPQLNDGQHISISHSKKLLAMIISDRKVGLDIEIISEKALQVSSKFISKNNYTNLSIEEATLIWCAKEALYKWHQKGKINFINDIEISPFIIKEKGVLIAYFQKQKHSLYYKKINNHFLVYVCK